MKKKPMAKSESNKSTIYMSIFIAVIMVTSGFGVMFYGFSGGGNTVKYNKHKFKITNLGASTKINGIEYYFEALPQEVEAFNITYGTKHTLLNSQAIVITSDPSSTYNQEIALTQFNMNSVLSTLNKQSVNAFTKETGSLPVITCENASSQMPVIEFIESNYTEAILEDYCLRVQFQNSHTLKAISSKILFLVLGVMDE